MRRNRLWVLSTVAFMYTGLFTAHAVQGTHNFTARVILTIAAVVFAFLAGISVRG